MKAVLITLVLLPFFVIAGCYLIWDPEVDGVIDLPGLSKPVSVHIDGLGNPVIHAESRADAYFALGFIVARERMFQMDLMRRKSAGRLSEIFGAPALAVDKDSRVLGLSHLAERIYQTLPAAQQKILLAYSEGVNAYLDRMVLPPMENLMLGYWPEKWSPEESLLVGMNIFRTLNRNEADERMLAVMYAALPKPVVDFLTPDRDIYTGQAALKKVSGTDESALQIPPELLHYPKLSKSESNSNLIDTSDYQVGSNQWAWSNGTKKGAMLANDMHLPLSVPAIWYQAELHYPNSFLKGITLPGLPLLVAGSNGAIAWGFTNAQADVLDLLPIKINEQDQEQYLSRNGWKAFDYRQEHIKVKNAPDFDFKVQETEWGPVSTKPLLGKRVAIQWTLLEADAVNLNLLDIDRTKDLDAAIDLFHHAGLPPLNVVLADDKGRIAWTLTGKLPDRKENTSVNWDHPDRIHRGWTALNNPDQYPTIKNPDSKILVTANNRVLDFPDAWQYGLNYANGYRAFRIKELLQGFEQPNESTFYQLQLDNRSAFYDFYHKLALSIITDQALHQYEALASIKQALTLWDGHADSDSIGFGLLVEFRKQLLYKALSEYLIACQDIDPDFKYSWFNNDTPLRALLTSQNQETLPSTGQFDKWNELILASLLEAGKSIHASFPDAELSSIQWGLMKHFDIRHPFSVALPWLSGLLNMPKLPITGCKYCVRVAGPDFGASMRMVVKPGQEENMLLILSTGQSGYPLSSHYRDQFQYWVNGALPAQKAQKIQHRLILNPRF